MSETGTNLIEELQQLYGFSYSFIESLSDGLLIINLEGKIIIQNSVISKITGFGKADLVGAKVPFPFWPEEFHDKYIGLFSELSKGQIKKEFKVVYKHKNEDRFPASIFFSCIKNNKDKVIAYIAVIEEVSKGEVFTPSAESYNNDIFSVLNYKKKY